MIARKQTKPTNKKRAASGNGTPEDWRQSLRRRLTKLPEIDGIFVVQDGSTIHVFSVIEELESKLYKPLMKQERLIEKDHPSLSFDFHTRVHQGRPPHRAAPCGAELVFVK